MRVKYFGVCFYACIIFIIGCTDNTKEDKIPQKKISNPYVMSFWGKNIKFMLEENPLGGYDTMKFDEFGNIVELQSDFIKAEFDKKHFMIRHRIGGDLSENNLISYEINDNILIQKWVRIMTYEWDYSPEDVNQLKTFYSVFVFDMENQLTREVNLKDEFIIKYDYENKVLIKTDKYNLRTETPLETSKYFYGKGEIERIEEYYYGDHHGIPDLIHYFNNGRLDSTQHLSPQGKVDRTKGYKYIYYN